MSGKNRNERQPDNLLGIENKDEKQSSAKSWPKPDRSREKARYMTKSTKSPLHANRDSGVGRVTFGALKFLKYDIWSTIENEVK